MAESNGAARSPSPLRRPLDLGPRLLRIARRSGWLIAAAIGLLVSDPARALDRNVGGEWSGIIQWPHVAVSMANLPDGRILTYSSNERDRFPRGPEFSYAAVYDPETGQIVEIPHPAHDMFCASLVMLEDGSVFISGGRNQADSPWTSLFDFRTNSWIPIQDMNRGRWYPTSVALPSGQVFIAVGIGGANHPEVWTPGVGWQLLTDIDLTDAILQYGGRDGINQWPLIQLDTNGHLFHHGATPIMHDIDPTGLGSISVIGNHGMDWFPDEGVSVMYDEGKILVAGGSIASNNNNATRRSVTIDVTQNPPAVTDTGNMVRARQFHNEVLLPNGMVAVIGGNNDGVKFNDDNPEKTAEAWDPQSGVWTEWNAQQVPRTYHSTALLLTDGRIISAGGGLSGNSAVNHWDAEIFSPPYLFDENNDPAVRPEIFDGPSVIRIGRVFDLSATPGMDRFTIVKMSATTHTMNTDQRFLEIPFTETSPGAYTLTSHTNPNVLTPGYWMLFALDADGVPSVSKVIQVVTSGTPRAAPPDDPRNLVGETASLPIEAGDPDGDPITFDATGLPDGLSIDPATGEITGTLTQPGIFNAVVSVDDGTEVVLIGFRWFVSQPEIQSEMGTVSVSQTGPDQWHFVDLDNVYVDPIVVMGPATASDDDPLSVRVRNVTPTRFEYQLDEWDYLDGIHAQETLSYLVIERGAHVLRGGQALVADRIDAVNEDFTTHSLPAGAFTAPPAVITQPTTINHLEASTTRLENVTATAFDVRLQQQEQGDGLVGSEVVHFVAIETGTEAGVLQADTTGIVVGENPVAISFGPAFSGAPHFFAQAQTNRGTDTMSMRQSGLGDSGVDVWADEETSRDSEVVHGSVEDVAWLAIDPGTGALELVALFNSAPAITPPGDQTHIEDDVVALTLDVTDADGDPVGFDATGLPPGLTIDPVFGRIEGAPTTAGLYTVTATVTDARGASGEVTFDWTILENLSLTALASPPQVSGMDVAFTASPNLSGTLEITWNFGDGSPPQGPSSSLTTSHSYATPGRYVVTVSAREPITGMTDVLQFVQVIHPTPAATPPVASSQLVYEHGADRIWVANPDNDTVTVVDAIGHAKLDEIHVGRGPRGLAIDGSGRIWVANKKSSSLSVIDPVSGLVTKTLELPVGARPHGIVFTQAGDRGFVALEMLGQIVEIDPSTDTLGTVFEVGPRPRHLAIPPDAATLWVSRFETPQLPLEWSDAPETEIDGSPVGGELIPIDLTANVLEPVVVLQVSDAGITEQSGPGVPNYLGAAAITPDGSEAWVPSKQDNVLGGTARDGLELDHDSTVRAITSRVDLGTRTESLIQRLDHDNASITSASAFDRNGAYLYEALEGNRAVAVVDPYGGAEIGRLIAGRAPQALVTSPDSRTLYVHNFMDRSLTVLDLSQVVDFGTAIAPTLATIPLVDVELLAPDVLKGKQLFYDAFDPRLALESYMACASCHNEGGGDGRIWDFSQFGEGMRSTISLEGRGLGHGKVHWSANFDEIQDFEGQIRFFGGLGLMSDEDFEEGDRSDPLGLPKAGLSADLDALAAYVASLTEVGISPHRSPDGTHTEAALKGQQIFRGQGCGGCHTGTTFSDSADDVVHVTASMGPDTGPIAGLDTPTLRGLWATGPYLHDGSAATLEEAIDAHAPTILAPWQKAQLVDYLLEIDDLSKRSPGSFCGLGSELVVLLPLALAFRRRRSTGGRRER